MPEAELRAYVHGAVLKTVVFLILLLAVIAIVGVRFESQLLEATSTVAHAAGVWGLAGFIFVNDLVVSPIPPDLALMVISRSELRENAWSVVALLGLSSCLAGNLGWLLGTLFGDHRLVRTLLGRFRDQNRDLVRRYGRLAIALGALTPVPFSITCWTAGLLKMRWRDFLLVSLLRVPRFLGYYVVIDWSGGLFK
jgi:membrane protein YqaA with SNARE-associated domain